MQLCLTIDMDNFDAEGKPTLHKHPVPVMQDYQFPELHVEVIKDGVSYDLGNVLPRPDSGETVEVKAHWIRNEVKT